MTLNERRLATVAAHLWAASSALKEAGYGIGIAMPEYDKAFLDAAIVIHDLSRAANDKLEGLTEWPKARKP